MSEMTKAVKPLNEYIRIGITI